MPDNFRKIHSMPTPLFGGLILIVNINLNIIFLYNELNFGSRLTTVLLLLYNFFFIAGYLDDKFSISPGKRSFTITDRRQLICNGSARRSLLLKWIDDGITRRKTKNSRH